MAGCSAGAIKHPFIIAPGEQLPLLPPCKAVLGRRPPDCPLLCGCSERVVEHAHVARTNCHHLRACEGMSLTGAHVPLIQHSLFLNVLPAGEPQRL